MTTEETKTNQVPDIAGLFTWPSKEPQLIGGHCKSCGTYYFPKAYVVHRPGCPEPKEEEVLLSRKGTLRSYTWQYYPPPPPFHPDNPFTPFGIGLISLPEGIDVVGMLTGIEYKDLKIGMPMEIVVERSWTDDKGVERLTWKFRPAKGKS